MGTARKKKGKEAVMWNYFALMFLYVVDKDRMQAGQKPDFKPGFLGALTTCFIFTVVLLSELAHIVVLCHFYVWGQDCDRPLVVPVDVPFAVHHPSAVHFLPPDPV